MTSVSWPQLHLTIPEAGYATPVSANPADIPHYHHAFAELTQRPEFIQFLTDLQTFYPSEFGQIVPANPGTYIVKFVQEADGTIRVNIKPDPSAIGKNIPLSPQFNHLHALASFMLGLSGYPVDSSVPPPVFSSRPHLVTSHPPASRPRRKRERRSAPSIPPDLVRMMRDQQEQTRAQARLIQQLTQHIASESDKQRAAHVAEMDAQRAAHQAELGRFQQLHTNAFENLQAQHREQIDLLKAQQQDAQARFDAAAAKMDAAHNAAIAQLRADRAQDRQDHAARLEQSQTAHEKELQQREEHHGREMDLLQAQIDQMNSQHAAEIDQLKELHDQAEENHEAELARLAALHEKGQEHHDAEIERLQELHTDARNDHAEQIRLIRADRADDIQRYREERDDLRADHAQQMDQLRTDHAAQLDRMDAVVQQVRDDAEARVQFAQSQFDDRLDFIQAELERFRGIALSKLPDLEDGPNVEPSEAGDDLPDDVPLHDDDNDSDAASAHGMKAPSGGGVPLANAAPQSDDESENADQPLARLRTQLHSASEENEELITANAQLRHRLHVATAELEAQAAVVPEYQRQIVQLRLLQVRLDEAQTNLARLAPMEHELGQLRFDLAQRDSANRRLGDFIRQLEAAAQEAQRTEAFLRHQLQQAQQPLPPPPQAPAPNQDQAALIAHLRSQLQEAQQQRQHFEQLATQLRANFESEQRRANQSDERIIELDARIADDGETIQGLETSLQQAQLALEQQRQRYRGQAHQLLVQYNAILQALQTENRQLFQSSQEALQTQRDQYETQIHDLQTEHAQLRQQWVERLAEANHARDLAEAEVDEYAEELQDARAEQEEALEAARTGYRQRLSRQAVDHLRRTQQLEARIAALSLQLLFVNQQLLQRPRPSQQRNAAIPRALPFRRDSLLRPISRLFPRPMLEAPVFERSLLAAPLPEQNQAPAPQEKIEFDPSSVILTGTDPIHDSQLLLEEYNRVRRLQELSPQPRPSSPLSAQLEDGTILHPMRPIPERLNPINIHSYLFPWLRRPSTSSPFRPFYNSFPLHLAALRPQPRQQSALQVPQPDPAPTAEPEPELDLSAEALTGIDLHHDQVLAYQAIHRHQRDLGLWQQRNQRQSSPQPVQRLPWMQRGIFQRPLSSPQSQLMAPAPAPQAAASSQLASEFDPTNVIFTGDQLDFQAAMYVQMNRHRVNNPNCLIQ